MTAISARCSTTVWACSCCVLVITPPLGRVATDVPWRSTTNWAIVVGMAWTQNNLGLLITTTAMPRPPWHITQRGAAQQQGVRRPHGEGIADLGIGQDLYELGSLEAACAAFRAAIGALALRCLLRPNSGSAWDLAGPQAKAARP